ncbi:MAG: ABC transporter substrate-binding protein [Elusimicrobia bacterium]|nr:ABC transporter substrate-binding protein [Elusimicrobiota bacterium]
MKSGPVAIVIARKDFLKDHSDIVRRFLGAERDELDWMRDHPAEARQVVSETITRLTGRQFETGVIDNAFSRVRFDMEISTAAIVTSGYQCDRLGFLGPADLETKGLIDDAPLRKVLNGHKPEEKK